VKNAHKKPVKNAFQKSNSHFLRKNNVPKKNGTIKNAFSPEQNPFFYKKKTFSFFWNAFYVILFENDEEPIQRLLEYFLL
jgi:hypothetical protein